MIAKTRGWTIWSGVISMKYVSVCIYMYNQFCLWAFVSCRHAYDLDLLSLLPFGPSVFCFFKM